MRQIDSNEFDDAERHLNPLLDLDDKDSFALVNARASRSNAVICLRRVSDDLAKENGVPHEELVWHEAVC